MDSLKGEYTRWKGLIFTCIYIYIYTCFIIFNYIHIHICMHQALTISKQNTHHVLTFSNVRTFVLSKTRAWSRQSRSQGGRGRAPGGGERGDRSQPFWNKKGAPLPMTLHLTKDRVSNHARVSGSKRRLPILQHRADPSQHILLQTSIRLVQS